MDYSGLLYRFCLALALLILLKSAAAQDVAINEVMASNSVTFADEDGDFEDWIELYNFGTDNLNLEGFGLSDSYENPFKWVFPDTTLQAGEYLLIWASGKNRNQPGLPLHTNFSISAAGEEVLLTNAEGMLLDELQPISIPTDISYGRSPDGTGSWFFFQVPTPEATNSTQTFSEVLEPPIFSHPGGFYSEPFDLNIIHPDPEVTIIFSRDGSIPDIDNLSETIYMYKNSYPQNPGDPFGDTLWHSYKGYLYELPLSIFDRSSEPDKLSQISATHHLNPNYFPSTPVRKGTVVRTKAFKTGAISSKTMSNTYFVWEGGNPYNIPVISISIQENLLFGYNEGIYNAGVDFDDWRNDNPDGIVSWIHPLNFTRRGRIWEYPCNVEIHNPNLHINQSAGFRIHGNASRFSAIKNLRLYARNEYDELNDFQVDLFEEHTLFGSSSNNIYKRLMVRGMTQQPFYDVVFMRLMSPVFEGVQREVRAIQFINGEYWGVAGLRERMDEYHFAFNFDLDPNNIVISNPMKYFGETHHPLFQQTRYFFLNNDLSIEENYQLALSLIDIRSFVDHLIISIYSGNSHYSSSGEVGFWRVVVPENEHFGDGRWRVFVKDFDDTLTPLNYIEIRAGDVPHWSGFSPEFNALIANSEFCNYFINRFADHINSTFDPSRFQAIVDEARNEVVAFLPEDHHRRNRWIFTEAQRTNLIDWSNQHPARQRQHIRDYFDIESDIDVTLDVNDAASGYIRINTITITPDTPGVPEEPYPWTGIYFHNIPIEVEAIPRPGHAFSHWTGSASGNEAVLGLTPTGNISLTAHFIEQQTPEPEIIHYWHFNTLSGTVTSVPSDYSVNATGIITYPGTGTGYMDERTHRAQDPVSNLNLQMGQMPDQGAVLRVRNPSDTRELIITAPSNGFESISLNYATTRTSNGATLQSLYYSADGGLNWQIIDSAYTIMELTNWQLQSYDLSGISEINDNPDLQFRILFLGDNASSTSGNNRFDNFSVHGVSTFVPLEFYSKATGDLNALATWGSEPDGSGTAPNSFTNDGTTFYIQNREEAILESNWTVTGIGSKVVVGDGSNPTNLVLNAILNAVVDVSAHATLSLAVADYPEFGQLEGNSTIVFKVNAQLIPYTIYHHLVLDDIDPEFDGNGTITVQGNLTLTGDVVMPDARGADQYSIMFTGSENQLIKTNAKVLRSFNMSFVKTQGEVSFTEGSIISTDNQLTFNFIDDALFSDNGITMYAGNSVNIGGDGETYNFTGTLILAGTEAGIVNGAGAGNNFNIRETGNINNNPVAALNNLVVRVENTGGEFRLRDGSTDEFTIKGDFIVESGAAGRIRFYGNGVFIGGNFIIEEGFAGTLDPFASLTLNGDEQQEIASGLDLNSETLIIDNTEGIQLNAHTNVASELIFENGTLHLGEDALVSMELDAVVSGFGEYHYINGRLGFTVNNDESLELFYPVGTQTDYVPFSFEVSHANTNVVVYIGKVMDFEHQESGLDETLEFVIEEYQYELDFEGLPDITSSSIKLYFEESSLGFDPDLLRITKFEAGQWINLGGMLDGESISSTESFTLPGTFALAKAAEEPEVPEFLSLQDITLPGTTDTCFAATQTVALAGDGTTFTIENGAIVSIIAGESIIAFPHTIFESGSHVHLFTDETKTWCGQSKSMLASEPEDSPIHSTITIGKPESESFIRLYPNPTTGTITIETGNFSESNEISFLIFSMMGEVLLTGNITNRPKSTLDFAHHPPGVYIIRILSDNQTFTKKIIKK